MADIVSQEKRSQMMAGIKGKNTRPELLIRKALHKQGFRYRLHGKKLAGKPDLVFPKYKAVLFIHGCFWHGHDCHLFKWPSTRVNFWKEKITRNHQVDENAQDKLFSEGWRVGVIWECSLRGRTKRSFDYIVNETARWLNSNEKYFQIRDSK
jgi:DNA mismatch endonuclease (patch repair protein)